MTRTATEAAPEAERGRVRAWPALLGFLVAFVLSLLASAFVVGAVAWAHGARQSARIAEEAAHFAMSAPGLIAVAAVDAAALLLVALGGTIAARAPFVSSLRLGPSGAGGRGFASALAGLLGLSFACGAVVDLLGARGGGVMDVLAQEMHALTGGLFALALLAIAVAPGFAEETFFRGFVQVRLVAAWGPWAGIAVTSAAFALIHLDPVQSTVAFVAGVFLGWTAERYRSIRPTIFAHVVNNALFVTLAWRAPESHTSGAATAVALVFGTALLAAAIVVIRREGPTGVAR